MTLTELKGILDSTGIPVTYRAWPEGKAPDLPFICYHSPNNNSFAADGITYYSTNHVMVELYSNLIDMTARGKIEKALTDAGIYWERSEEYIDTERCYETIYECEV